MGNLLSTTASMALLLGMGVTLAAAPVVSDAQQYCLCPPAPAAGGAVGAPGVAPQAVGPSISASFAPPALPTYEQPPIPAPGYVWTPGYWGWDRAWNDYYWVPGTWVQPPVVGVLWTPGYWGWTNGVYLFNQGYWGPTVGYYGGISYGFGYTGFGYAGGYWQGGHLFYNRAVNNIANVHITNVYNKTVIVNNVTNVSFHGPGGVLTQPTTAQVALARARHIPPTAAQARHVEIARTIPANHASVNGGKPAVAATQRPGEVKGPGVVAARSAPVFHRPANAPPPRIPPAIAKTAGRAGPGVARTTPGGPKALPGRVAPATGLKATAKHVVAPGPARPATPRPEVVRHPKGAAGVGAIGAGHAKPAIRPHPAMTTKRAAPPRAERRAVAPAAHSRAPAAHAGRPAPARRAAPRAAPPHPAAARGGGQERKPRQ